MSKKIQIIVEENGDAETCISISRKQAVEKMAKAMCGANEEDGCVSCSFNKRQECERALTLWKKLATKALHALLEGKK